MPSNQLGRVAPSTFAGLLSGAVVLLGFAAGQAQAQWVADDVYDVRHDFSVTPGGNVTPRVTLSFFQHAWIYEYLGFGAYWDAKVAPAGQNPGFDMLGYEGYVGAYAMNYPNQGSPVFCKWGSVSVPDTGGSDWGCTTVISPNSNTFANACAEYSVSPFGVGTPITGFIRAVGGSHATTWMFTEAYAFSATSILIEAGTQLASGQIVWTPWTDSVHGSSFALAVRKDPITISWDGPKAGQVVLLDSDFNLGADAGAPNSSWANDVMNFNASSGEFTVTIDPVYTSSGGTARMKVSGGVVVDSSDDGVFDGLLPAAGTAVPVSFTFPSTFKFKYDVSSELGSASNVQLEMGGGGGGSAMAGCPADVDGSGFVDTDDFDFFVGMYIEGGPADFDRSGFVDTDDFDAFVRAFERGC